MSCTRPAMRQPSFPEAGGRLILIGTVHRHPGTFPALLSLLEELQPTRITLEISPFAVHWRLAESPRQLRRLGRILDRLASRQGYDRTGLDEHPTVQAIRALIALPAEFRATVGYAGNRGLPLHLLDDSRISARRLRQVEKELVTLRNLLTLLALPEGPPAAEGCGTASRLIEQDPGPEVRRAFLAGRRQREGIGLRDARMAQEIVRHLQPGERLVHIGGWVHLVEDELGETLFSRLRHLGPQRVLALSGRVAGREGHGAGRQRQC